MPPKAVRRNSLLAADVFVSSRRELQDFLWKAELTALVVLLIGALGHIFAVTSGPALQPFMFGFFVPHYATSCPGEGALVCGKDLQENEVAVLAIATGIATIVMSFLGAALFLASRVPDRSQLVALRRVASRKSQRDLLDRISRESGKEGQESRSSRKFEGVASREPTSRDERSGNVAGKSERKTLQATPVGNKMKVSSPFPTSAPVLSASRQGDEEEGQGMLVPEPRTIESMFDRENLYQIAAICFASLLVAAVLLFVALQVSSIEPFASDRLLFCAVVYVFAVLETAVVRIPSRFALQGRPGFQMCTVFSLGVAGGAATSILSISLPSLVLLPTHNPFLPAPREVYAQKIEFAARFEGSNMEMFAYAWLSFFSTYVLRFSALLFRNLLLQSPLQPHLPSIDTIIGPRATAGIMFQLLSVVAFASPANPAIVFLALPLILCFIAINRLINQYILTNTDNEESLADNLYDEVSAALFLLPRFFLFLPLLVIIGCMILVGTISSSLFLIGFIALCLYLISLLVIACFEQEILSTCCPNPCPCSHQPRSNKVFPTPASLQE